MKDPDRQKREHERALIWGPLQEKFKEEALQDEFMQIPTKQYRSTSLRILAGHIAECKVKAAIYGPELVEKYDLQRVQHVEFASKVLEFLLQKKLFNMQLLWRANRLQIPEIKISYDFESYGDHITNCPFLGEITDKEVEVLRQFMRSFNFEMDEYGMGLSYEGQRYKDLMELDNNGDRQNMPEFYEFYDGLMGTFYLLDLPDERGLLEKKYILARATTYRKEQQEKQRKEIESPTPKPAYKPSFYPYNTELTDRIFSETESPEFMEYKRLFERKDPRRFDEFEIRMRVGVLESISDAEIKLPSYLSWDEALRKAAQSYQVEKAAEVLDLAVEQYRMKADLGLFDTKAIDEDLARSFYRAGILQGRAALGEPENFDF